MRKLTVHREKSFVACLMPIHLYITSTMEWGYELMIDGEGCKKLGSIKNGQTKIFEISNDGATIYAVYGKTDSYFGKCVIPCSNEDVTVSGKSQLDPIKGNPFVFNKIYLPQPSI